MRNKGAIGFMTCSVVDALRPGTTSTFLLTGRNVAADLVKNFSLTGMIELYGFERSFVYYFGDPG